MQTVWRRATSPVPLLGNSDATTPDFVTQFFAVLCRTKPFELDVHGVKRVIFTRLTDRRVDDLFIGAFTFRGELGRKVDVLKASPATDIEAKDVFEVVSCLNPVLHHVREGGAPFRRQPGFPVVREFLNNLDAVSLSPFAYLVALNGDRVFLAILSGVSVIRHRPNSLRRIIRRIFVSLPPFVHRLPSILFLRREFAALDRELRWV